MNRLGRSAAALMLLTGGMLAACDASNPLPLGGGGAAGEAGSGSGVGAGGRRTSVGVGGNTGGLPVTGAPVASFDTSVEGFELNRYHETTLKNLADAQGPSNPPPTLTFDGSVGSPTAGSLLLVAPFSGVNQYVDVQKILGTSAPANWNAGRLHVRVRIGQGTFKGGVNLYVVTGTAYVYGGTSLQLAAAPGWQELVFDLAAPTVTYPGYDPSQIVAFGIQFATGGTFAGATPVSFDIDSFSVDPPPR